ncbi:Methyltransferase domain protein [compost metagenome]
MESFDRKAHWEKIYHTKPLEQVSWYQPIPVTSLEFINELEVPLNARIIDIGGGDSFLAEHLLDLGYQDITVLDISEQAIQRAKERLEHRADQVKWIVSDILDFVPDTPYDLWHDRAAFHFLIDDEDVKRYVQIVNDGLAATGNVLIGTFALDGPAKCSGIDIRQYSEETLNNCLKADFEQVKSRSVHHATPFDTLQHFVFSCFRKR